MASSKLLLNLSVTFLCSYRTSFCSSRRLLPLYTFSPLTKSQLSLRFSTSVATSTVVDLAPASISDQEEEPLDAGHPWPEWNSFVEKLRSKGYFERATTSTGQSFNLLERIEHFLFNNLNWIIAEQGKTCGFYRWKFSTDVVQYWHPFFGLRLYLILLMVLLNEPKEWIIVAWYHIPSTILLRICTKTSNLILVSYINPYFICFIC
jgi:hypothetical protein